MHIPIDDRDPLDPELLLRVPCRDDDVPEDAETHRRVAEGMVPWWAHERETTDLDCADRAPCSKPGCLPRRRLADRVVVEPALLRERGDPRHVIRVVDAPD